MNKAYYRADIDGLRALAIIPVLFFHLGLLGFSGGFIGVDIFFVISGYLITSIIIRELAEGRFSLIKFWERRIRRIMPVLFVVLLTTTIASYFITLFPPDFTNYGQSLAAQGLFLVNIFFMRTGDYFAAPSDTVTLLHTWSLAVEEQFYIIFPVLVFLLFKFGRRLLLPALITLTLVSFAYSVYLVNINPGPSFSLPFIPHVWGGATNANAGFYFPLARAWELFAGALLALCALRITHKPTAEAVALGSLLMILGAILFIKEGQSFPGLLALLPVLGTMGIIAANTAHTTFVSKLLSFPVLVWIGLISYALYLWHWPLIVLTQQYFNTPLTPGMRLFVLCATFALSIASYFLIETPLRTKKLLPRSWHIFAFGCVATLVTITLGVLIVKQHGFPHRAPAAAQAIASAAADTNPREYECFRNNYRQIFGEVEPCTIGVKTQSTTPSFVLWGDSHSNAAMPVFEAVATESGTYGTFFAAGGCPPLVVKDHLLKKNPQCKEAGERALAYIKTNNVQTVFLVSSWDNEYPHYDDNGSHTAYEALAETIDQIPSSTRIVILQRVPAQPDFQVRKLFYNAIHDNSLPDITVSRKAHTDFNADARQAIERLALERKNISIIDPLDAYCSALSCPITYNGSIIYTDANHLNTTGALLLQPLLQPFFTDLE